MARRTSTFSAWRLPVVGISFAAARQEAESASRSGVSDRGIFMIAENAHRVPEHTAAEVNRAIAARTERRLAYFEEHPAEIPSRLEELDREWDVERALAMGSSCLSLLGLTIGFSGWRRWFFLPLGVQAFYLQHTLQGWCPPLPVFRRLGFRTPAEIERERCALEALQEPTMVH